jgi:hypothetical protein
VLSGVRPISLAVGVELEVASLAAYSMLTRGVLSAAGRPPLWTLARIDLTTLGVSHVVPGGAATSSTLRYRLLTGAGVGPSDTIAGEAIEGAGSEVVLNVLLWIALVISLRAHGGNAIYLTAAVLGTALIVAVFTVVVLVTHDGTATVRRLRALARRPPAVSPDSVERLVRTFAGPLRALAVNRRQLARTTLWAVANWALDAAALWVFLAAYGHRTDLDATAWPTCSRPSPSHRAASASSRASWYRPSSASITPVHRGSRRRHLAAGQLLAPHPRLRPDLPVPSHRPAAPPPAAARSPMDTAEPPARGSTAGRGHAGRPSRTQPLRNRTRPQRDERVMLRRAGCRLNGEMGRPAGTMRLRSGAAAARCRQRGQ